jgi:hypothetical protein
MDGPREFKNPDDLFHNKFSAIAFCDPSTPNVTGKPDLVADGYTLVHKQNGLESLKTADQSNGQKSLLSISKESCGDKIKPSTSEKGTDSANSPATSCNSRIQCHTEQPIVLPSTRKSSGLSAPALSHALHALIPGHALKHKRTRRQHAHALTDSDSAATHRTRPLRATHPHLRTRTRP